MKTKLFEYLVVYCFDTSKVPFEKELNSYGSEGWEVIGIDFQAQGNQARVFFKKESP